MLSHTNNANIEQNPEAHSWAVLKKNKVFKVSHLKTISNNPMADHATTGMFWFKSSKIFKVP